MDKQQIAHEMARLAAADPNFRVIHNFFRELVGADKNRYIIICRARMPHVAQTMVEALPALAKSKIMQAMNNVHALDDEQIVKLSAMLLDVIVKSVDSLVNPKKEVKG